MKGVQKIACSFKTLLGQYYENTIKHGGDMKEDLRKESNIIKRSSIIQINDYAQTLFLFAVWKTSGSKRFMVKPWG